MVHLVWLECQRNEQFSGLPVGAAGLHNSHHAVLRIIHRELLADNIAVAAQPIPEPISEDDFAVLANFTFFGEKIPPEEEANSKHPVGAGSLCASNDPLRLFKRREVIIVVGPSYQVLKDSALPSPLKIVSRRDTVARAPTL